MPEFAPVEAGKHNTLMSTTKLFAIAPGEHVSFQVINRAGCGTYWMLAPYPIPLLMT